MVWMALISSVILPANTVTLKLASHVNIEYFLKHWFANDMEVVLIGLSANILIWTF